MSQQSDRIAHLAGLHRAKAISEVDVLLADVELPTYSDLIGLLIRAEDTLKARAPHATVLGSISGAIASIQPNRIAASKLVGRII